MSKQQKDTSTLGNEQDYDEDDDDGFDIRPRIEVLKERARTLGIAFSPNIGEAKLAEKIEAYLADTQGLLDPEMDEEEGEVAAVKMTDAELKAYARKQAQKLVRVNITALDPMRAQLNGELILTGNSHTGTIAKMIPFNTPRGYMVPQIILDVMKERTFTQFRYRKDEWGNQIPYPRQLRAFNIEYLKPLTEKQLEAIALRQRAAQRVLDEEDEDLLEVNEE